MYLCDIIGFDFKTIKKPCNWYVEMYAKQKQGLVLYVDWKDYELRLYVVELIAGHFPDENAGTHLDGIWHQVNVDQLYNSVPLQCPCFFFEWTEAQWEQHLYKTMEHYISLIQNNPETLLAFFSQIDGSSDKIPIM